MTEPADQPVPEKRSRSLTGFYVAVCIIIALGLFGAWFWRTWTVWWFDAGEARRRQAEAAAQLGLPVEKAVDLGDGVKLELVLIPAGRFRMGSPAKEKDREGNEAQHWVMITRLFYMGKHEVTQEQWEKVMGTDPSNFKGAKNPVDNVSWNHCQDFLKKLNALVVALPHPHPSPTGRGSKGEGLFRLPTEAEWEYACRAGTQTRFCAGDADGALADYAWFEANSGITEHPVGEKKPNAWGLHDMHGNVWEWCADWYAYDYYAKNPKDNPTGPAAGEDHVLRGGGWNYNPAYCRSAYRRTVSNPRTSMYDYYFGFRVVAECAGP